MSRKRRCFVIGPIGTVGSEHRRHADMLLNAVVREVLAHPDFGYDVVRSDEVADPGMINDKVIHDIVNSDLVVADLTFLNPNAFYELGIRHATMKPTIHFAQLGTALPFDSFGYRAIIEDITDWHGIERAREQLRKATTAIEEPTYKASNPITQANASFQMRTSSDPLERIVVKLVDRLERMEGEFIAHKADRERLTAGLMDPEPILGKGLLDSAFKDFDHMPLSLLHLDDGLSKTTTDISQDKDIRRGKAGSSG